MTPYRIKKIFDIFQHNNPEPETELVFNSAFECLVAVILSAQATDISVNKATQHLFKVANTPKAILALSQNELEQYIKSIGLYHTKAKNIRATAKILHEEYHDQIPDDRQTLQKLPGVGRKTANVILNVVFKQPTLAVDTHIFRVSQRIGLAQRKTPLAIEQQLLKIIPKRYQIHAHHWLILHGRYICTARHPHCNRCPINRYCDYSNKSSDQ